MIKIVSTSKAFDFQKSLRRTPAATLFVAVLPFTFFPKLIGGDTQPWPLLAVVFLFFMSKSSKRITKLDAAVLIFALCALLAYLPRSGMSEDFARFGYKVVSFVLFWLCVRALSPALIAQGMKSVIVIWFAVGLFQTVFLALGFDVGIPGRFVAGRGGVPSLAPEPSLYGMLSIIAVLYLMHTKEGAPPLYILLALGNVFLSGSILAILASFFVFPLLSFRTRAILLAVFVLLIGIAVTMVDLTFLQRVRDISSLGFDWSLLLADYSINLRVGHIVYTLWAELPSALLFQTSPEFEREYNNWASGTGRFFPTGSNHILPGIGDMVYRGGLFGLGLTLIVFSVAFRLSPSRPWIKLIVLLFLTLSQLGIASPFVMLYALQRAGK